MTPEQMHEAIEAVVEAQDSVPVWHLLIAAVVVALAIVGWCAIPTLRHPTPPVMGQP